MLLEEKESSEGDRHKWTNRIRKREWERRWKREHGTRQWEREGNWNK